MFLCLTRSLSCIPRLCLLFAQLQSYKALANCLDLLSQVFALNKEQAVPVIDQILSSVTQHVFADLPGDEEIIGISGIPQ